MYSDLKIVFALTINPDIDEKRNGMKMPKMYSFLHRRGLYSLLSVKCQLSVSPSKNPLMNVLTVASRNSFENIDV